MNTYLATSLADENLPDKIVLEANENFLKFSHYILAYKNFEEVIEVLENLNKKQKLLEFTYKPSNDFKGIYTNKFPKNLFFLEMFEETHFDGISIKITDNFLSVINGTTTILNMKTNEPKLKLLKDFFEIFKNFQFSLPIFLN